MGNLTHHSFPEPETYALNQQAGDFLTGHFGEFLAGNNNPRELAYGLNE